jgi:hypothetical protein
MAYYLPLIVRNWRTVLVFAVGMLFAPSRASAECGDYIKILNHKTDSKHSPAAFGSEFPIANDLNNNSPIKAPCHGPNCSNAPVRDFPPSAPSVPVSSSIKEMTEQIAIKFEVSSTPDKFERDHSSQRPIYRAFSVFHPPRLG